ncbi:MAG: hypothetical protein KKA73_19715 [Chloroflexi bacterium]|nr:hypothetical protein [Chloroflexota bacterium]MBU1749916.1 hypothetical protein [Chloroflexota bacterium]MBU1877415.1 hypothetical protein [Chloroflexota bacterium]
MTAQQQSEQLFLEYCAQVIAQARAEIQEAIEDDVPVQSGSLFQDRVEQLERVADLVRECAQYNGPEPLEKNLDRRLYKVQRQIMVLASRVYSEHGYPPDYWRADVDRELLTELLAAWHRWNSPDRTDPILNV